MFGEKANRLVLDAASVQVSDDSFSQAERQWAVIRQVIDTPRVLTAEELSEVIEVAIAKVFEILAESGAGPNP